MADSILDHLKEYQIDHKNICVLGCDGTSNNTGWKNGSMAHLEQQLGRPCQRIVCLLHHCELPFRKLFEALDGQTSGPNSFCGPIGQMASTNVWEMSPLSFEPIHINDIPDLTPEVLEKLSTDARYLYDMCNLVNYGTGNTKTSIYGTNVGMDILHKKIGPLCHSRWLTLASRILRMYVAMDSKSPLYSKVQLLAKYIVGVYWKTHIQIKYKNTLMDGPKILFEEICFQRELFEGTSLLSIIQRSVQQNCFFAHPENLLLAMLGDEDVNIRTKAVRMIAKIRDTQEAHEGQSEHVKVREFHLPQCNFAAHSYTEMVAIQEKGLNAITYLSNKKGNLILHEPPLVKDYANIKQFIEHPLRLNYPNHTQAVERAVKLTTAASGRIAGQKRQMGEALCTIAGRKKQWVGKNYYVTRKAANQSKQ